MNSDWTEMHECRLVVQAQMRDPAAFRELVHCYERRLLYYLNRMLGSGGESLDVMQDVWLMVFRKLPALEVPQAFRVWFYKIAHDVAVSHLRRTRRLYQSAADGVSVCGESERWNEFEALERAELVHRTLERLSPPHREVLALRFLEGLDIAEIAAIVGCSPGTVKSRLHYAKHALRLQIEGTSNV